MSQRSRVEAAVLTYLGILLAFFARTIEFWQSYLSADKASAWDGSGHLAALQIYSASIFPKVSGWSGGFFGGIPFPNFYPPLWFFLSSALHRLSLPVNLAGKWVVLVSALLIPLVLGVIVSRWSKSVSGGALGVVIAWMPFAANFLKPSFAGGLTLTSTFETGIYTEPLGMLLLLLALWSLYRSKSFPAAVLTAVLLAGVILSNAFAAMAAIPMLLADVVAERMSGASIKRLAWIAGSALALSAFWWVPLVRGYWTVVTLPLHPPLDHLFNSAQVVWIAIGLVCNGLCLLKAASELKQFSLGLFLISGAALLSYVPGLEGLPLQLPRFVGIIVFLLVVPIAVISEQCALTSWRWFTGKPKRLPVPAWQRVIGFLSGGLLIGMVPTMQLSPELYNSEQALELQPVLGFARAHNDGRYLVQVPHAAKQRYSARALSSYLGAQGNESAFTVYREDSTGSLFYVPLADIISGFTSTFGLSSSLIGDKDLLKEPGERLRKQLNYMGVRYLVKQSEDTFNSQAVDGIFPLRAGRWEVYELPTPLPSRQEQLSYLPALVLGDISYKQRRSGQIELNRLLEEQFRSADFDVTLVHARDNKDALSRAKQFGALIFTDYQAFRSEDVVPAVKEFAAERPVILFPSVSAVFAELRSVAASHPNIHIVDTDGLERGELMGDYSKDTTNLHLVEELWRHVVETLKSKRTQVSSACARAREEVCPLVTHYSFDAWWQTPDRSPVYIAGPASILTFGVDPERLSHQKRPIEIAAGWLSLLTAMGIAACASVSLVRTSWRGLFRLNQ